MKTKAKKFSNKLLALFLAVVMALTCFTGVLTAYAESKPNLHDENVEYNELAWNVLSDEQIATAVLDYADEMLPALAALEPTIADMINGSKGYTTLYDGPLGISLRIRWDINNRQVIGTLKTGISASDLIKITVKLGSVDELLETLQSVNAFLTDKGLVQTILNSVDLGMITDLNFTSIADINRQNTSSCDIIRAVFGLIYNNNDLLFGNLLRGELSLGVIPLDVYGLLGGFLGVSADDAKANFAYNIVKSLLFNYTEWFTDEEELAYNGGGTLVLEDGTEKTVAAKTFVFDEVLLEKMTTELLDKISVLVTYPDGTSSATRRAAIEEKMASDNLSFEAAAAALGYDSKLVYSTEKGMENNILLFAYGDEMIKLEKTDSLFSFGYQALKMAWNTVLKDTVKLIHVNYSVDRGHGTNFDNAYYYWAEKNLDWDHNNLEAMYSETNVKAWAEAVYKEYDAESVDEFLGWVKHNFEHDRTVAEGAEGIWSDIDSSTLFNKLRYSPLADYYFNMQTGPINLYFMQTGTDNLDKFFAQDYAKYSSLVSGFNDCLVAAVKDIFVDRDNIYVDAVGDTKLPTMDTTLKNNVDPYTTVDDYAAKQISSILVNNALKIVQYVADTTDKNILNGFYKNGGTTLTEANLEKAMIPLLVSCIGNVNLGAGRLDAIIHPSDWNACQDAEAVAFVALREYLSYILPQKDYNALVTISEKSITAKSGDMLNTVILPMARDAVTYVMQGYVPVVDPSGNEWRVEQRDVSDKTTLLQLLNSVVCYYADNYVYDDGRTDNALGVASLLGVCDTNGKSNINTGNEIWTNFDLVANKLMPVLGELQGNGAGNFDSEDLIWNDVVLGIFEISDKSIHNSGLGGVSNFIYRFISIMAAAPIQSDSIILTVYNFVKDLFNGLFGPRYTNQSQVLPVPAAASADNTASAAFHPFDDMMQKATLAGTKSGEFGIIQRLINNFVEFIGFGPNGRNTYPDTLLPGLTFALTAVNSMITLLESIGEHHLKMATAEFADSVVQGCIDQRASNSSVTIKNNSVGVNVAYIDGMSNSDNDRVVQLSRYYINVKRAEILGTDGGSTITAPDVNKYLAPGETMDLATSSVYLAGTDNSSSYVATLTYDVCVKNEDGSYTPIHEDLTTKAYQYLTGATSWQDSVYTRFLDGMNMFPENDGSNINSANATWNLNGYQVKTTDYFGATSTRANRLTVGYPTDVVLSTDNLSAVNNFAMRLRGITYIIAGDRSMDGMYYYDNATVWNDGSNSNVTVGQDNAVPIFDKTNGDILKLGLYDISTDGGNTWDRTGYTDDGVSAKSAELGEGVTITTRTHVAATFDEANTGGAIAAYHINEHGEYDYIYLKSGNGDYRYDVLLSNISVRGPIDGFYLNSSKLTINTGNSQYFRYLSYDGETDVPFTDTTAHVCFYNGTKSATADIRFVVCDVENASSVNDKVNELTTILANYKETDFINDDVYQVAEDAIVDALGATALPITPDTAAQLSDKTEYTFNTKSEASATGDVAFVPLTEAEYNNLSADVKNMIYTGDNGLYYFDSQFKAPVYSQNALTAAGVTGGKDAAGMPVVVGEDGRYHIANTALYEKEWIMLGDYPYLADTSTQATNDNGDLLYNQVQWSYYDKDGNKVTSRSEWVIKVPDCSWQIIPSSTTEDNRGLYTKANDNLEYVLNYVYDSIDTTLALDLLNKVSLVRDGMNNNNFEIVTYNKMVDMAKTIESQYTINVSYTVKEAVIGADGEAEVDADGNTVTKDVAQTATIPFSRYNNYSGNDNFKVESVNSNLSSTQIDEYVRLFEFYMGKVVERGYQGKQLEAEIVCASGNDYAAYTVTPATYDEEGNLLTAAEVKSSTATAKFGKFVDGVLVNEGDTIYTAESWERYVNALADAVALAQLGNGSYAHKTRANYVADANDYNAQVTNCYSVDTELQAAEIALTEFVDEPPVGNTHNVTANIVIASNASGATKGTPVYGTYTMKIFADAARTELVDTVESVYDADAAVNTVTAALEDGTYYVSLSSDYMIARDDITIVVNGADIEGQQIPVVPCDYDKDGYITADDAKTVFVAAGTGNLAEYCDLDGDGYATADDAKTVYVFSAGSILPALTIQ